MNATKDDTRQDGQPAAAAPASQHPPLLDPSSGGESPQPVSADRPGLTPEQGGRRPAGSADQPTRRSGGSGVWVLLLLVLVAAAVVGGLFWKRSGEHQQLAKETEALAIQHVNVTRATSGQIENEIVLPGNLSAFNEAPIFARTSGYLKSWSADIGTQVKGGQALAQIETPDVDAQLRQADATLSQAKANLEIANLNFGRQKDLLLKKVASQQEYDQNRTNVEAMKAAVQADEAAVQNLTVQKNFQNLVSPFDGVVTRRNTDVGALINAGAGQELFRVARIDILRVNVYVPQAYAALIKDGATAYLELTEFPGKKFPGKVAHIAGAIDPATRTLQTEIQVDNKDGRLFPGAFANAHLVLPLREAPTVIPVESLIFRSQGAQVAVVDARGVVHHNKVTIGHDYGTSLEITGGLTREDRIVVNPPDSLADGAKVQAQEAAAQGK